MHPNHYHFRLLTVIAKTLSQAEEINSNCQYSLTNHSLPFLS